MKTRSEKNGFDRFNQLTKKVRTITYVNDLLDKSYKRVTKIRKLYDVVREEIFATVTPNEKGEYILYYTCSDGTRYKKQFLQKRKENDGTHTYSWDQEVALKTRDETLEFLLNCDETLELGNKFRSMKDYLGGAHQSQYKIQKVLNKLVTDKVYEKYKDYWQYKPETLIIKIGKDEYLAKYDKMEYGYQLESAPIVMKME